MVAGSGENPGTLNTGDGTVILAQKADAAGRVRAFSEVRIVSGRPVVVLQDSHQIEGDRIRWGYRGGTLDINGNDMTFHGWLRLMRGQYSQAGRVLPQFVWISARQGRRP
ncbi:peptidase S6, IgA endopeptidase from phage origin [Escherichia coli]|uniref:Peptidase S6, IgA endopeptidase from phage origin n=1 Tax=Escherichia coli TaxID=562 RepID=A0A377CZ12_ECOLX|nr:peptidase S6, IgA endopeptidase from phage origin [Escherichia coli]